MGRPSSGEARRGDDPVLTHMQHQQVIDSFIKQGSEGRGAIVKADANLLSAEFPERYAPWGRRDWNIGGRKIPLAVRLKDDTILVNGAGLPWPASGYQTQVLNTLRDEGAGKFGVVPFDSVVAAWTDGEVRDWNQKPIPIREIRSRVAIAVPSGGERYRTVSEKDKYGRTRERQVHTLGDSVVRVRDRYYLSAIDETGAGWNGMYFLAELQTERPPQSLEAAFDLLKPKPVLEAEARGSIVRRQGEWFAIPTSRRTSELMADVARGIAVHRNNHVLGREGHHQLEEYHIAAGDLFFPYVSYPYFEWYSSNGRVVLELRPEQVKVVERAANLPERSSIEQLAARIKQGRSFAEFLEECGSSFLGESNQDGGAEASANERKG